MNGFDLIEQNPWWENRENIENDIKIAALKKARFQWRPAVLDQMDLSADRVYTIRGCRQVGKTTVLKLIIRDLIKAGTLPQSIFYYSLDFITNYQEIAEIFKLYKKFVEPHKPDRCYVFLDEITLVTNWQLAIKYLIDRGFGRGVTFILTGSSSGDLRRGSERMPGRRGGGAEMDKVLLPLSFSEYVRLREPSIPLTPITPDNLMHLNEDDFIAQKLYIHRLQDLFQEYILCGGLPPALENFHQNKGTLSQEILDMYQDVIFGDVERWKKNRLVMRQVMQRIYHLAGSRSSWHTFVSGTDIGSFHTAVEYIQTLCDAYIAGLLYHFDLSKQQIAYRKEKKIYTVDPLFFQIFARIAGEDYLKLIRNPRYFGNLMEHITFAHLLRLAPERLSEGLAELSYLHYWRSVKGREIDFLLRLKNVNIPIEVKYQSRIVPSNYLSMKQVFRKGIVLTQNHFFKNGDIVGIPLVIFLAGI